MTFVSNALEEVVGSTIVVERSFFPAGGPHEVVYLGVPLTNGHPHDKGVATVSDVPKMAAVFTAVLTDDSENEPPDFDVPGDDFGS